MFKALVVTKDESGATHAAVTSLEVGDLPAGDVVVAVEYSTVNYKDGLCLGSGGGMVRAAQHEVATADELAGVASHRVGIGQRRARRRGFVNRPTVPPVRLDLVQRAVRQRNQLLPPQQIEGFGKGRIADQTQRRRHLQTRAGHLHRLAGDRGTDAAAEGVQLVPGHRPEHHQEFLAAPADHVVAFARQHAQAVCDGLQDVVAGLVAVAVVDRLEVVDVEQRERQHVHAGGEAGHALVVGDVGRQLARQVAAVVQAGQRIGEADRLQLPVGLLQVAGALLHQPLKRIAIDVGYGSEAALSRAFKAQTGQSPRQWKEGVRAATDPS